ncbi:SDR family oxidoreductase [Amycolatopsis sp. PS_44_ISF1]|uniref:SDR family NAD(P)-dependent oxidoreductase n=1 Tax=Amycolatopsis sp. PS_44_ISF1 TaxID=2974917 RepID=UPI0028DDF9D1|nr:SDR family oxidoreductase [Amycolatopsis sp. PS_44_ISF1]MDT8914756.1 SDR family oxidoreductase [Amycolatopsis sp. PS_44_ISF1]
MTGPSGNGNGPGAALITGGGAGIGRALALVLARRGVPVVVADFDQAGLEATIAAVEAEGASASGRWVDVTERGRLTSLVEDVAASHGLGYLFNNAGIGGTLPFDRATPEQRDRILELNLRSVIEGTTAAYRVMTAQGHGHIVNTASVAGLVPVPGQTLYNTTKFAVVGLSRTLRIEAAPHGVRVSVVCPGNVATDIFAKAILHTPATTRTSRSAAGDANVPADAISAAEAADEIVGGVDRNEEVIVFPRSARHLTELCATEPEQWNRWATRTLRLRQGGG